jgi:O-methyltransferase
MRRVLEKDAYRYPSINTRIVRSLCALSINSLRVFLRKGPSAAKSFLANSHRVYSGYGMPKAWERLPWRENLRVPQRSVGEIFPEVDFTRCPELLFPMSRDLGPSAEEMAVLCGVVGYRRPERVIEFGTAEGRTAVNLALHLPEEGKIITLDLAPIPGKNEVGYFYWNHPAKAKITQVFCSVTEWDSRPYRGSADVVFADACDLMPGLGAELFHAITVVKPGGVIFRHDYGSSVGATYFWNWVSDRVPVFHIPGTTLVCLRLDSEEIFQKAQGLLSDPLLRQSVVLSGV